MTAGHMGTLTEEVRLPETGAVVRLTPEHKRIISLIEEGTRVVDLGCGEGDLLLALKLLKGVRAEGIELSEACIQACVAKGLFSVHHGDLDEGLADYPDKGGDNAISTTPPQLVYRPIVLTR